jgi:hypothetical protein
MKQFVWSDESVRDDIGSRLRDEVGGVERQTRIASIAR